MNTQQVQGSSGCRDYHYTSWEQGRCEELQGGQQDRQGNKKKRSAYFCRGETVKTRQSAGAGLEHTAVALLNWKHAQKGQMRCRWKMGQGNRFWWKYHEERPFPLQSIPLPYTRGGVKSCWLQEQILQNKCRVYINCTEIGGRQITKKTVDRWWQYSNTAVSEKIN